MPSNVQTMFEKGLIKPPRWLPSNVQFEAMMGSVAYGVSGDTSDVDVYGWCIPTKETVFPHLSGEIYGFGRQIQRFEQWQQHHVAVPGCDKVYDFSIFNIVKYFQLLMENNPNVLDSLFVPANCILHITRIGTMVRESRRLFLHKGSWHKFKGYAYSQLHKMRGTADATGKRAALREQFGFDVKFAYHVVRLLDEAEQILSVGDIDLQRNREHLKAIRRGEVSEQDIRDWASSKEKDLEKLYSTSPLPYSPDEPAIKKLLLECLEFHFGSLEAAYTDVNAEREALRQISDIIEKVSKHYGP